MRRDRYVVPLQPRLCRGQAAKSLGTDDITCDSTISEEALKADFLDFVRPIL